MINTLSARIDKLQVWIRRNPGKWAIFVALYFALIFGIAGEADYQEEIKQEQR